MDYYNPDLPWQPTLYRYYYPELKFFSYCKTQLDIERASNYIIYGHYIGKYLAIIFRSYLE